MISFKECGSTFRPTTSSATIMPSRTGRTGSSFCNAGGACPSVQSQSTASPGSSCISQRSSSPALAKSVSLSICLLYVMCRRSLARRRDNLSKELTEGLAQLYAKETRTVSAREVSVAMPLLQRLIDQGDVCESCALRWIERKLNRKTDRMKLLYSPRDLEIIREYLAMMGK